MTSQRSGFVLLVLALALGPAEDGSAGPRAPAQTRSREGPSPAKTPKTFLGFDRNDYPGDAPLPALRSRFAYAGFWLNNPPGATSNTWAGRRSVLAAHGFGFLVLFNGRLDAELKRTSAAALGRSDGAAAVSAARREGFPAKTVIFLDVEEGGRMLPEQKGYIYAWIDSVNLAGFRAGVYCSGIPAREAGGTTIITANDIRQNAAGRSIEFWVANDACPPSPGCVVPREALPPTQSGVAFADIWQYAQSPRRADVARACTHTYAGDGNCYAASSGAARQIFVDMNTAREEDPSHGRTP